MQFKTMGDERDISLITEQLAVTLPFISARLEAVIEVHRSELSR
jgi:hypothetical protein